MRPSTAAIAAALAAACALAGAEPARPPAAQDLISAAEKTAKQQHKNVMLIFHASWCGWCKRMDALFERPDFHKAITSNYVVVHVDVLEQPDKKEALENPGGGDLLASLGGAKSGIPFYVFFDPDGKKLADSNVMPKGANIGYPGAPDEVTAFGNLLKQTAPHLTDTEREKLVAYLRANPPSTH